ncbi:thiamine diphosphokinase [Bifidobacterium callimiconis]|uniref:thiamine diphosphokinase n=1 Tax=Bifidobacterium callimiconis TaxID=2306973 RepID=UPI001BDD6619|nr:thiamine diphosphokinase [Bifidobacterium callimiconis]MBT1176760.1 thiamine diphosphokinase [Bifidobacterium callimiconis]
MIHEHESVDRGITDCVIFGAGEYYDEIPDVPQDAYVVAADGGLDHTRFYGIETDAIIGDFDSVADDFSAYIGLRNITRLPSEKDETDMLSAVKIGWAQGARRFHIYGGLGGRLDHTLANMQMLARMAYHGGIGFLHGNGFVATAIADATLDFPAWDAPERRMVSVFAHSDRAKHVSIRGLKYEVDDVELRNTRALGVSNEFLPGRPATIGVGDGTLSITFAAEAPSPTWRTTHETEGPNALGGLDTEISALLARR